jgi:hypothetical protein
MRTRPNNKTLEKEGFIIDYHRLKNMDYLRFFARDGLDF